VLIVVRMMHQMPGTSRISHVDITYRGATNEAEMVHRWLPKRGQKRPAGPKIRNPVPTLRRAWRLGGGIKILRVVTALKIIGPVRSPSRSTALVWVL
jgi:hypothetical protein